MENKTILFGGSGLLGPVILEKFPDIVSVGRTPPPSYIKNAHVSINSLDELDKIDSLEFDSVIFLIGSSDHHLINSHPTMGIDYNVVLLKKALNYFKTRNIKKFICFTTILLYKARDSMLPCNESHPINPYVNDYVFSKHLSEEVIRFYKDSVPSIIMRCSNIYGPTRLVRPDLIPTLIQDSYSCDSVSVWNKKPQRDFIYLEDAADAIVSLIDTDYTGIVNLGTGATTSVDEISNIIEKLSGKKVVDLEKKVKGPMYFQCDTTLLYDLTGWKPKYTLDQGIEKTYKRMGVWKNENLWPNKVMTS